MTFERTTVAAIAAPIPRAIAIGPFGSSLRADMYTSEGVPVIRGQDIRDHANVNESDLVFVAGETAARFPACQVRKGDLVFPHRGAIGRVALVGDRAMMLSSSMMKLTCDPEKALPEFILYYFRGPGKRELLARASTVGTPGIGQPLASLRGVEIELPLLAEQRAIAEVLGALDDKIAANNFMAEVADALVRAQFEAVARDALSAVPISDFVLQPRELVEPSGAGLSGTYVGLEHVPRRLMWLNDSGAAADVTSTKAAYRRADVLFGKLRPYFHKVVSAPSDGICSTDILVLRAKSDALSGFLLAAASSDATVERCTAASEGTRMPRTSWKDLGAVRVPWPGESDAKALGAEVDILRHRVEAALAENAILAELRDTLLPELMSGRLRVKDAERAVGETL